MSEPFLIEKNACKLNVDKTGWSSKPERLERFFAKDGAGLYEPNPKRRKGNYRLWMDYLICFMEDILGKKVALGEASGAQKAFGAVVRYIELLREQQKYKEALDLISVLEGNLPGKTPEEKVAYRIGRKLGTAARLKAAEDSFLFRWSDFDFSVGGYDQLKADIYKGLKMYPKASEFYLLALGAHGAKALNFDHKPFAEVGLLEAKAQTCKEGALNEIIKAAKKARKNIEDSYFFPEVKNQLRERILIAVVIANVRSGHYEKAEQILQAHLKNRPLPGDLAELKAPRIIPEKETKEQFAWTCYDLARSTAPPIKRDDKGKPVDPKQPAAAPDKIDAAIKILDKALSYMPRNKKMLKAVAWLKVNWVQDGHNSLMETLDFINRQSPEGKDKMLAAMLEPLIKKAVQTKDPTWITLAEKTCTENGLWQELLGMYWNLKKYEKVAVLSWLLLGKQHLTMASDAWNKVVKRAGRGMGGAQGKHRGDLDRMLDLAWSIDKLIKTDKDLAGISDQLFIDLEKPLSVRVRPLLKKAEWDKKEYDTANALLKVYVKLGSIYKKRGDQKTEQAYNRKMLGFAKLIERKIKQADKPDFIYSRANAKRNIEDYVGAYKDAFEIYEKASKDSQKGMVYFRSSLILAEVMIRNYFDDISDPDRYQRAISFCRENIINKLNEGNFKTKGEKEEIEVDAKKMIAWATEKLAAYYDKRTGSENHNYWNEAVAARQEIANMLPKDIDARLALANAARKAGDLALAEKTYLGITPPNFKALVGLSEIYMEKKDFEKAANVAEQAYKAATNDEEKAEEKVTALLTQAAVLGAEGGELLAKGEEGNAKKKFNDAADCYVKVLALQGVDGILAKIGRNGDAVRSEHADLLKAAGRFDAAAAIYRSEKEPLLKSKINLAEILVQTGKLNKNKEDFDRAIEILGKQMGGQTKERTRLKEYAVLIQKGALTLAWALSERSKIEKNKDLVRDQAEAAFFIYRSFLRVENGSGNGVNLNFNNLKTDAFHRLLDLIKGTRRILLSDKVVLASGVSVLNIKQNYINALAEKKKTKELIDFAFGYPGMKDLLEREEKGEALSIKEKEFLINLYFALAGTYTWTLKKHEKGISYYEKAIKLADKLNIKTKDIVKIVYAAKCDRAKAMAKIGKYEEAKKALLEVIANRDAAPDGNPALAHKALADIYNYDIADDREAEKNYNAAINWYQKIPGSEKEQAGAYFGLGDLYRRLKDFKKARENYRRTRALFGGDKNYSEDEKDIISKTYANMAEIEKEEGLYNKAVKYLDEAKKWAKTLTAGDLKEALDRRLGEGEFHLKEEAKSMRPSVGVAYSQGTGNYQGKAADAFRKALVYLSIPANKIFKFGMALGLTGEMSKNLPRTDFSGSKGVDYKVWAEAKHKIEFPKRGDLELKATPYLRGESFSYDLVGKDKRTPTQYSVTAPGMDVEASYTFAKKGDNSDILPEAIKGQVFVGGGVEGLLRSGNTATEATALGHQEEIDRLNKSLLADPSNNTGDMRREKLVGQIDAKSKLPDQTDPKVSSYGALGFRLLLPYYPIDGIGALSASFSSGIKGGYDPIVANGFYEPGRAGKFAAAFAAEAGLRINKKLALSLGGLYEKGFRLSEDFKDYHYGQIGLKLKWAPSFLNDKVELVPEISYSGYGDTDRTETHQFNLGLSVNLDLFDMFSPSKK